MAFFPEDVAIEQIDVPYTATDFQPYCLTVRQAEAQAVMTAFNPQQIPTMMQTCNQLGLRDLTWVVPSSVITPEILDLMDESSGWTTAPCSRSTRPPTRAWPPTTRSSARGRRGVEPRRRPVGGDLAGREAAAARSRVPGRSTPRPSGPGSTSRRSSTPAATPLLDFTAQTIPTLPRIKNVTPWGGEWADGTAQPDDEPLEIDFSVLAG